MPEFVEVEADARRAEEGFDAEAAHVHAVMGGAEIEAVSRIGKLLLIHTSARTTSTSTRAVSGNCSPGRMRPSRVC